MSAPFDPFDDTAPSVIPLAGVATIVATANLTIATALVPGQVIDGYTLVAGDVILLTAQSAGSQNGLYVSAATPVRHPLFSDNAEVEGGICVKILKGTVGTGKKYELTTVAPIIVGTTALAFSEVTFSNISPPGAAAFDNTAPGTITPPNGAAFDNTAPGTISPPGAAAFDNTAPVGVIGDPVVFSASTVATSNLNLTATINGQSVNGVALGNLMRVLLIAQTNPAENGLWQVNIGVPTRDAVMDTNAEANRYIRVTITSGDLVGSVYALVTPPPINLGVTPIFFGEKSAVPRTI